MTTSATHEAVQARILEGLEADGWICVASNTTARCDAVAVKPAPERYGSLAIWLEVKTSSEDRLSWEYFLKESQIEFRDLIKRTYRQSPGAFVAFLYRKKHRQPEEIRAAAWPVGCRWARRVVLEAWARGERR